jgi:hypothetical protein
LKSHQELDWPEPGLETIFFLLFTFQNVEGKQSKVGRAKISLKKLKDYKTCLFLTENGRSLLPVEMK